MPRAARRNQQIWGFCRDSSGRPAPVVSRDGGLKAGSRAPRPPDPGWSESRVFGLKGLEAGAGVLASQPLDLRLPRAAAAVPSLRFCGGPAAPHPPPPSPRLRRKRWEGACAFVRPFAPAGAAPGRLANRVLSSFPAGAAWRGLRARSLRTCLERYLNARRHPAAPGPRGREAGPGKALHASESIST